MRKWDKRAVDERSPEVKLIRAERIREVQAALARLDRADRIALKMRLLERRTLQEVGEVLGVSRERVRQRVVRAVLLLRELLATKQPV